MSRYENLLIENNHLEIRDTVILPDGYNGFYSDGVILLDKRLNERQKLEILNEELSHHKLTHGNILNQSNFNNRKFENYAVRHSYETAMPLNLIINAYKQGISSLYELAEFVQLSESYVIKVLEHYKQKFGLSTYSNGYLIIFEPLQVFKYIEKE